MGFRRLATENLNFKYVLVGKNTGYVNTLIVFGFYDTVPRRKPAIK
jgi:hypothetical protein